MKNQMPSEGLRLGRDSGSVLCDSLKKWPFRTAWGGGPTATGRRVKKFLEHGEKSSVYNCIS